MLKYTSFDVAVRAEIPHGSNRALPIKGSMSLMGLVVHSVQLGNTPGGGFVKVSSSGIW